MAGIKEAMKRVVEHRNEGKVIAIGETKHCFCEENSEGLKDRAYECEDCGSSRPYMIIELTDGGIITQFDNNGDVRFAEDIKVCDHVMLEITSNWTAMWKKNDYHVSCTKNRDMYCAQFHKLPTGIRFAHDGKEYESRGTEKAYCITDKKTVVFKCHWGCFIPRGLAYKIGLKDEDERR